MTLTSRSVPGEGGMRNRGEDGPDPSALHLIPAFTLPADSPQSCCADRNHDWVSAQSPVMQIMSGRNWGTHTHTHAHRFTQATDSPPDGCVRKDKAAGTISERESMRRPGVGAWFWDDMRATCNVCVSAGRHVCYCASQYHIKRRLVPPCEWQTCLQMNNHFELKTLRHSVLFTFLPPCSCLCFDCLTVNKDICEKQQFHY